MRPDLPTGIPIDPVRDRHVHEMATSKTIILESVPDRVIAEITFHGGDWKDDRHIRSAISDAVETHEPAAILLNLSDFRYRGGDYVSGFLAAFYDDDRKRTRPACFVAAPNGLRSVFNTIDPTGIFAVRYFDDHDEALHYLKSRLQPSA